MFFFFMIVGLKKENKDLDKNSKIKVIEFILKCSLFYLHRIKGSFLHRTLAVILNNV